MSEASIMSESSSSRSPSPPLASRVRERGIQRHESPVNVGDAERWASLLGGGAIVFYGLSRKTLGGLGLALLGGSLVYRGVTGYCGAYQALGIDTSQSRGPRDSVKARHGVKVEESVTVLRPREELYRYWRDFSNLPRIMRHLKSVETKSDGRSHWVATGPMEMSVEWDAEIITERENELIGWRSVGDSEVDTAGSVHFLAAPGDRGTEIRVVLKYDPPAGKLGAGIAWLFGKSASRQIREDLRRFKSMMETGTIPTTEGQPRGA
jgi:uncharacterized membrane protein